MGANMRPTGGRQPDAVPEINVTPLVDVVLVLLIIFMVITPALDNGAEVELPAILHGAKGEEMDPIEVVLTSDGEVLLDQHRVARDSLQSSLQRLYRENSRRRVRLLADVTVRYGDLREAFALIRDVGFPGVSLQVTERKKQDS